MKKKITAMILVLVMVMTIAPSMSFAKESSDLKYRDYYPLRYIGFVVFTGGVILDTLIARPIQYVVSRPVICGIVGYQPDDCQDFAEVSDYAY